MKRRHLLITGSLIICIMIAVLCSCDLITTDKDRFTLDKNDYITMIDLDKTGPNVVIPEKIEDKNIRGLYLYDPYFSEIDSIDVSNASQLEYVSMDLFGGGKKSKIKKLDFSKNTKLRNVVINRTNALNRIIFNERCETISLFNTSIKELDLKSLKKLKYFSYYRGPLEEINISDNLSLEQVSIDNANVKFIDFRTLKKIKYIECYGVPLEELDISNNPNLEEVRIYNTNVRALDISNNPKLKRIEVDEGTDIIGETDAEIKYWTKEDIEKLEELRKND